MRLHHFTRQQEFRRAPGQEGRDGHEHLVSTALLEFPESAGFAGRNGDIGETGLFIKDARHGATGVALNKGKIRASLAPKTPCSCVTSSGFPRQTRGPVLHPVLHFSGSR